jgi:hypothetical protein
MIQNRVGRMVRAEKSLHLGPDLGIGPTLAIEERGAGGFVRGAGRFEYFPHTL